MGHYLLRRYDALDPRAGGDRLDLFCCPYSVRDQFPALLVGLDCDHDSHHGVGCRNCACRCGIDPRGAVPRGSCAGHVLAASDHQHRSATGGHPHAAMLETGMVQPMEVFTFAIIVYFLLLFPTTRTVDFIYRRLSHLGRS